MQKAEKIIGIIWYAAVAGLLALSLALFSLKPHLPEALLAAGILVLILMRLQRGGAIGRTLPVSQTADSDSLPDKSLLRSEEVRVWILAFVTRYACCSFLNDKVRQQDDFAITLEEAGSGLFTDRADYYRQWIHKMLYPLLLHRLGLTSQTAIYLFQCILLAFTAVLVCRIAVKVTGEEKAGVTAAILYIAWPGQCFYAAVITEEHMAAFLTCSAVLILFALYGKLSKPFSGKRDYTEYFALSVLAGLILGLVKYFKDWGAVVIAALIISGIWLVLHLRRRREMLFLLAGAAVILLVRSASSAVILQLCEKKLGNVTVGNNVVISQMYATLDPDSTGAYNEEKNAEYLEIVRKNNYDFRAANREALGILAEKIRSQPSKMPGLLYRKGTTAYVDDASQLYWALVHGFIDEEVYRSYRGLLQILWFAAAVYYVLMVLCLIRGMLRKQTPEKFFLGLVILGGICVSLIIESHGRYKYSIEPLWCVLCCTAFEPGTGGFFKSDRLKSFIHQRGRGSAAD